MWILTLLLFILILGIIILVHEFGHFIWAKTFGVHIYEFSIGMGPVVFSKKGKDGINYNLRAFPIGGFVQMAGEVYEDDEDIPKEKFMCNKKWHQRLIILIAGVVNNFILAIVLLFFYGLIWGVTSNGTVVKEAKPDYPMAQAGIVAGDEIISINGHKTNTWDKAQIILAFKNKNEYYTFEVKHQDGKVDTYKITPKTEKNEDGEETKVFGVAIDTEAKQGFFASIKFAFQKFGSVIETMALTVTSLFSGKLSVNSLSGPVGIYQVVGQGINLGISYLVYILAFLSINVGFINILPFPAFDGGRVLFMIIEKIIGRPVDSKIENVFHAVGFFLLMLLMVYITFQDIIRLF
ncbi:MAG: RIP metalloprotease RseP [Bacilli bacterium]|nr:RIP metalloprotease RseP [Bacilli bacterium]